MNIITIMNYPDDRLYNTMCMVWMYFVQKYCGDTDRVVVLTEGTGLNDYLQSRFSVYSNFQNMVLNRWDPPTRTSQYQTMHNVAFKLYNLCRLDFPFIFIDADAVVLRDPRFLWDRRDSKPFIAIDHQQLPDGRLFGFLNSGVLVVGKPVFADFDAIVGVMNRQGWKFDIGGCDQPCWYAWFKSIGYDYRHDEVGPEWNSCADFNVIRCDNDFNWSGVTSGLPFDHDVCIHHYWNRKPWELMCPLYCYYHQLCY